MEAPNFFFIYLSKKLQSPKQNCLIQGAILTADRETTATHVLVLYRLFNHDSVSVNKYSRLRGSIPVNLDIW